MFDSEGTQLRFIAMKHAHVIINPFALKDNSIKPS